ncbi:Kinesin motor domain protein [Taphrina deformans PYCC 5710]|uniref:Kinesin-like protein n=1 Tax=Taphrina deformans (strain PYCC 5710 / ATCC 11124 / CBS 356.35 / IMI 108563 / JCM 9778 / NBRC 8474) TaxID=1097556 RepID=R4XC46_TAPDE|nr:Kinesin motor domain protein [Taphrina deformans PYCC 5710]|eukprot:CCG83125.1 Kinesin motor domain protein [Taphrina deformans PYCC 5710]
MPAPTGFIKPKPESRKTLIERQSAAAKAVPASTLVRSKSSTNLSHSRSASISSNSGSRTTLTRKPSASSSSRPGTTISRPNSVNGMRPGSATGSRPGSATGSRPDEANAPAKKVRRAAWDTKGRLEDMEEAYKELKDQFKEVKTSAVVEKDTMSTELQDEKAKTAELMLQRQTIQTQFDAANEQIGKLTGEMHIARMEREQLLHRHRMDLEDERATATRAEQQIRLQVSDRERELESTRREAENMKRQYESQIEEKSREIRSHQGTIGDLEAALAREKKTNHSLQDQLAEQSTGAMTLQQFITSLKSKIEKMETEAEELANTIECKNAALASTNAEKDELKASLINEETQRRILHNQIQELKGNIRVFCRIRPALSHEPTDTNSINTTDLPDEVEVTGTGAEMSLSGKEDKTYGFHFDKVFGPSSQNNDVFAEISQLVQSALDGYNVSIFAYGQTGSGKTHTMSSADGMIPRAVSQIYKAANDLKSKGWEYSMEGSFLEIYCENMRDLLASRSTPAKLDIRHDEKKKSTQVDGLTTVRLDSPSRVDDILEMAARNRTVAATAANERSSRSHSVFMLALEGKNEGTGERSRGVLNLIDLAGSERLNSSHAAGDRLKETQAINKSLSCLADVIYALGNDQSHIPYRNSKLTYLLQYSLGGNSKTLMFVNVSPLKEHVGETLCSLRFATKVNSTQIGTAKAQKTK